MAGENRGRYLLIGLIMGGIIGAVIALWIVESRRVRFRKQGPGVGSALGELVTVIKDEVVPRVKEAIGEAMLGREAPRRTPPEEEEGRGGVEEV